MGMGMSNHSAHRKEKERAQIGSAPVIEVFKGQFGTWRGPVDDSSWRAVAVLETHQRMRKVTPEGRRMLLYFGHSYRVDSPQACLHGCDG